MESSKIENHLILTWWSPGKNGSLGHPLPCPRQYLQRDHNQFSKRWFQIYLSTCLCSSTLSLVYCYVDHKVYWILHQFIVKVVKYFSPFQPTGWTLCRPGWLPAYFLSLVCLKNVGLFQGHRKSLQIDAQNCLNREDYIKFVWNLWRKKSEM